MDVAPAEAFVVIGGCLFEELISFAFLECEDGGLSALGFRGSCWGWLDAGCIGGNAVGPHHTFVSFGSAKIGY